MIPTTIDRGRVSIAGNCQAFVHLFARQAFVRRGLLRLFPALPALLLASTAVIVAAAEARSGDPPSLGLPTSPYRAEIRIQAGNLALNGIVRHAVAKERIELLFTGMQAQPKPIIIRRDIGVTWVLTTPEKTYLESKIAGDDALSSGVVSGALAEKTEIGPDNLNDRPVMKYRVKFAANPQGEQLSGVVWISPENILLRLDGEVLSQAGKRPFTLNLEKIELGPQPDAAFELPEGYRLVRPSPVDMGIREPSRPGRRRPPMQGEPAR